VLRGKILSFPISEQNAYTTSEMIVNQQIEDWLASLPICKSRLEPSANFGARRHQAIPARGRPPGYQLVVGGSNPQGAKRSMVTFQWHGDLHNVEHLEGKESSDFFKTSPK
jgi:hypothetical protein